MIKVEDCRIQAANYNQLQAKILGAMTNGFTRENAKGVLKGARMLTMMDLAGVMISLAGLELKSNLGI